MKTTLTKQNLSALYKEIGEANDAFSEFYPGEPTVRQAVHTVYGGAQIFKAETASRLGELARRSLEESAPDFASFAKALKFPGSERLPDDPDQLERLSEKLQHYEDEIRKSDPEIWLAWTVYQRVQAKLDKEPVEDFRIDFEDGYGNRPDEEEDKDAVRNAKEVAKGMASNTLPPFIGIRIKPFTPDLKQRSLRTLDLFLSALAEETGGKLPPNFVVTIPKVVSAEEVTALVNAFELIEAGTSFKKDSLKLELMIETPQSLITSTGEVLLPKLITASRGRCVGAHFGVYDYTASVNITADYQSMDHPACDFARHMMKVSFASMGINISDGATNIMPIGPHRAEKGKELSDQQAEENRETVHRAWRLMFDHVNHSLRQGYYQGWDLHPAQFPVRYAAVYLFFLRTLDQASHRLKTFVERAAQATLVGDVFDDAATGQGLLNYFIRGMNCGAITIEEAKATGLTLEEIRGRSFVKIFENRRKS